MPESIEFANARDSSDQPVASNSLKSVVLVILDIVEVTFHKEAVVGEIVIVHDILLINDVWNIRVEVQEENSWLGNRSLSEVDKLSW